MAAPKYSRIQEKGQVTVPADIRRRLDLEKGDLVSFEEKDGSILMIPYKAPTDDIEVMDEFLRPHGITFQDLIDQMRDERVSYVETDDGIELSTHDE